MIWEGLWLHGRCAREGRPNKDDSDRTELVAVAAVCAALQGLLRAGLLQGITGPEKGARPYFQSDTSLICVSLLSI